MKDETGDYYYQQIASAIRYLHEHYRSQPGLDDVAREVGMSTHHFQKIFTEWAGISPKKYLQNINLSIAQKLLKGGDVSLEQVTYELGLSGTGRLHDLFVSIEAMTPGDYKNNGSGLEIRYGFHPSPFGEVLIASTEKGICKLSFISDNVLIENRSLPLRHSALLELKNEWSRASFIQDEDFHIGIIERIFGLEPNKDDQKITLNIQGTPFQVKVWRALLSIPAGTIASYNYVASAIEKPSASRAVGSAIGKNPVAFLIPCHRVIKQAGGISGYRWDPDRKRTILSWEACKFPPSSEAQHLNEGQLSCFQS